MPLILGPFESCNLVLVFQVGARVEDTPTVYRAAHQNGISLRRKKRKIEICQDEVSVSCRDSDVTHHFEPRLIASEVISGV